MTPHIIDLAPAGETMGGARVYARPLEAAAVQAAYAVRQFCLDYPDEIGRALAFAAWGGFCEYFVRQALSADSGRRQARGRG